ncbi:MAG TPA: histidine kinase N-terminal 7TM domain-containing protein, partial [Candidatus Acidoferrum sp.]|nr:histidine kinase N-terminal 7TM domain-containing protein [Candidatus Acidoferrum sp.]
MFQELKFQLSTALLTILTLAAGVSAIINFQQQHRFQLPEDGVIWVERKAAVEALYVKTGGPGFNGGIHVGDRLLSIDGVPVQKATDVTKVLVRIGPWSKAQYQVLSRGVEVKPTLVIAAAPMDRAVMYQYLVGAAYLLIGLFVYFRRSSAHKAQHFYILCLTSFIFFAFHYTGHLDSFDKVIYFGNLLGGLIAPTVFLHFCLTFPEPRPWIASKTRMALLYAPAAIFFLIYIGFTSGVMSIAVPLIELRWMLDRAWVVFATLPYLIGGFALSAEYHRTEDTVTRQQLKWLRNGAFSGILPFALFYVLPYALGAVPNPYMKMSVLSVMLIPLTLAYAIVRYRLMDVDIIFRRGYAYTMATVCVLAGFYGIVFGVGRLVNQRFSDLGNTGLMTVMLTTAFLFQPIRNWIQERLDMRFYRDRYDYRRTLVEFARELTSETDLDTMLHSVGERLLETLQIKHLTFFLAEDSVVAQGFLLKKSMGPNPRMTAATSDDLDLSFLIGERAEPYLFFERTRHQLDAVSRALPATVRKTIADLDLTYYVPCKVRARTIAFIGLSRTVSGDYLSSIDVELLMMLAGYVGIAIENSALYRSLQRKVEEYERLKEFSENIVESINVGILAVDLEDRVESWNTQIEHLTGITREQA